jgi:hypothetical protein
MAARDSARREQQSDASMKIIECILSNAPGRERLPAWEEMLV